MFCPKCGKMLELDEKQFCRGCGADVSEVRPKEVLRKERKTKNQTLLPYGARYISGDTEIRALGLGLVIGAVVGFISLFCYTVFVFYVGIPRGIGYGLAGMVPVGFLGMLIISKISNKAKIELAEKFEFIKTDGVIYHLVDLLCLKIPGLKQSDSGSKKNRGKKQDR